LLQTKEMSSQGPMSLSSTTAVVTLNRGKIMADEYNKSKVFEYHRMTDDELRTFIIDYVDGKIFTMQHIPDNQVKHILHSVFMPLIFFDGFDDAPREVLDELGTIYQYYDQAGKLSINGFPIFMSMRIMWRGDWERVVPKIQELLEKRAKERKELEL
jgi:hypothetical protein